MTHPAKPTLAPGEIEAAMKALQHRLTAYVRAMPHAVQGDEAYELKLGSIMAEMTALISLMQSAKVHQAKAGGAIMMPTNLGSRA